MAGVLDRKDVREEERWNDSSVFPSPQVWDEAFEEMGGRLEEIKTYKGTLSQGSERLADWLEFRSALYQAYYKLAVYAVMARLLSPGLTNLKIKRTMRRYGTNHNCASREDTKPLELYGKDAG